MDELIKQTASDIKECANACDAYARKRLLTKVIKAPSWDATLKGYIQLFSERKGEFSFRISVHTGIQVDRANDKLDTLIVKCVSRSNTGHCRHGSDQALQDGRCARVLPEGLASGTARAG